MFDGQNFDSDVPSQGDRSSKKPVIVLMVVGLVLLITSLLSNSFVFAQTDSLRGVYRVDLERSLEIMDVDVKAKYDELPTEVKSRATNSMNTRSFIFHADGQLEVSWGADAKVTRVNGTWAVHLGDDVKLVLSVTGDVKEYLVAERSNEHLLLKNRQGTGLFNNMYLVKID